MHTLDLIQANLLSPMVLAFALGIAATLLKSDLRLPESLYTALSTYLLLAIGLKGGVAIAETHLSDLVVPAVATIALGIAIPIWCFALLRKAGKFSIPDAAAIAAHYGSVSAVTFTASQTYLDGIGVTYEGFLPALVALLEIPGIVVAIFLAQRSGRQAKSWREVLHEVVTGKSVLLLLGGVAIGALSGPSGIERVAPFFIAPFAGVLTLFLLDLGVVAGGHLRDLRKAGAFLIGFGIVMPIFHGALGVVLGHFAGLSHGGSMVFGTIAASASYIAAPAAVRLALPEANPGYYLTAALAITFPFNLILGLPLYEAIARAITR